MVSGQWLVDRIAETDREHIQSSQSDNVELGMWNVEWGMWNEGDFSLKNPIVFCTSCQKIFTIILTFTTLYIQKV